MKQEINPNDTSRAQMDGAHAGKILATLQEEISRLSFPDNKTF